MFIEIGLIWWKSAFICDLHIMSHGNWLYNVFTKLLKLKLCYLIWLWYLVVILRDSPHSQIQRFSFARRASNYRITRRRERLFLIITNKIQFSACNLTKQTVEACFFWSCNWNEKMLRRWKIFENRKIKRNAKIQQSE